MKNLLLGTAASLLSLAPVVPPTGRLQAAELKVLAGGSMTGVLNELGPQFERASDHRLVIHFDSTPNLIKQATSEPFDLGIVPVDLFKDAAAKARFGPTINIARAGYGLAVRAGHIPPASAAGAYVSGVFERLGIGEAMKAKTKVQTATTEIPKAVARGDAELGVFLVNVLMAPGVELAGSFPAELQQELVFTAAVAVDTQQADAAKAFIHFLTTPAAIAVIKARGMSPG